MGQGKSIRLDRFLAEMKQGTRSQGCRPQAL